MLDVLELLIRLVVARPVPAIFDSSFVFLGIYESHTYFHSIFFKTNQIFKQFVAFSPIFMSK